MKSIFPGYSKDGKQNNISDSGCKEKLSKEKFSSNKSFKSYLYGYLINVDDAWKIRKLEDNEINYLKFEGHNIIMIVKIVLALIQIKYKLEEHTKNKGIRMLKFERRFWKKYELGLNLIKQVCEHKYLFDIKYLFDNITQNKDKLYFLKSLEKIFLSPTYSDKFNSEIILSMDICKTCPKYETFIGIRLKLLIGINGLKC